MFDVLKKYAKDHNIPILGDEGLLLIKNLIEKHHIKDVLEIGTAMGYSALAMSSFGCFVDTMERDLIMIDLAKENFARYDTNQNIRLIETNALTFDGELKSYDLIFIDAAKAQYVKFFEKYAPYLKKDGFIVCDNLNFHHLDIKKVNRNTRQLLNKIHQFKSFLMNNNDFITTFTDVGDGMSISKRK